VHVRFRAGLSRWACCVGHPHELRASGIGGSTARCASSSQIKKTRSKL
jgi:hypothetical protein